MNALAVVQEQEVLDVGAMSLAELAKEANSEHAQVVDAVEAGISHAIRCGELLLQCRAQVEPRGWVAWLAQSFDADRSTAHRYMRIAKYRALVEGMSTSAAHKALRGLPVGEHGRSGYGEELRRAAKTLVTDGVSRPEAAKILGVSYGTVNRWTNPQSKRRQDEQKKRQVQARRALQQQEQERAIKTAARKAGGAMAEAYAMAERMQDVLGQAHSEATDSEARRALSMAGAHYRKMRDEIVRALGVQ